MSGAVDKNYAGLATIVQVLSFTPLSFFFFTLFQTNAGLATILQVLSCMLLSFFVFTPCWSCRHSAGSLIDAAFLSFFSCFFFLLYTPPFSRFSHSRSLPFPFFCLTSFYYSLLFFLDPCGLASPPPPPLYLVLFLGFCFLALDKNYAGHVTIVHVPVTKKMLYMYIHRMYIYRMYMYKKKNTCHHCSGCGYLLSCTHMHTHTHAHTHTHMHHSHMEHTYAHTHTQSHRRCSQMRTRI
jgi:hypothetical protein